jgi:hypothetical protein
VLTLVEIVHLIRMRFQLVQDRVGNVDAVELVRDDDSFIIGLRLVSVGLSGGSVVARLGPWVGRQGRDGSEEGEGSEDEGCRELHVELG